MTNTQVQLTLIVGLLCHWVNPVSSHGRLWQPPGRSTMWRRGYNTSINYQDHELYCGGYAYQVKMGYKCGVCGDPFDKTRDNEAGGKYATGQITQTYIQGQRATFQVDLTANHKGYFEFKVCPTNDPKVRETQECFDLHPVSLSDGSGTRHYVGQDSNMMNIEVVLPSDLTCSFCVLQWRYHAGNSWGTDNDGTSCVGCGMQEEFYGCADVRILASESSQPGKQSNNSFSTHAISRDTPSDTTKIPAKSSSTNYNQNQITASPSSNRCQTICRGVSGRTTLDKWCQINCKAGFCPDTHCTCAEQEKVVEGPSGCRASGSFSDLPGYDKWCSDNCAARECPSSMCVCS